MIPFFSRSAVCLAALSLLLSATTTRAQVGDDRFYRQNPPKSGGASGGTTATNDVTLAGPGVPALDKKTPLPWFDPATEVISYDGKLWNVTNQRVFRGRFEKYLAAPEATPEEDAAYRAVLEEVRQALSPSNAGGPNLPKAAALLPKAAQYPIDARLCDSLANAVYAAWLAKKNVEALRRTNTEIERQTSLLHRNVEVGLKPKSLGATKSDKDGVVVREAPEKAWGVVSHYIKQLTELEARKIGNSAKIELSETEAKIQFQTLTLQYFFQRRFEHVIIASRIYRLVFADGDQTLRFNKESEVAKALSEGIGFTPTMTSLDDLSNEAIRDVDEGVQAYAYLAGKSELESASKRLSEAFMMGEYLPRIRTLPRTEKDRVLEFVRDSNQMLNALEVKDYGLVESLVRKLGKTAKDFDASKPTAAVETARTAAGLHLNKARTAFLAADQPTVSAEIAAASEIWPNNPMLKEVSEQIFRNSDVQGEALRTLDQLLAQKNFRAVFNDQAKFLAASAGKPDAEKKLREVLTRMGRVEVGLKQAERVAAAGDRFGAWEIVETLQKEFPADPEISTRRATLAVQAAELASALSKADELEQRRQPAASLAWLLKARRVYPNSSLAREGIERLANALLEDEAGAAADPESAGKPAEVTTHDATAAE